jgi:hypothetical protein
VIEAVRKNNRTPPAERTAAAVASPLRYRNGKNPSLFQCFAEEPKQRLCVRRVSGWSAFPVQSHVRWDIVPGEFDRMPAALVVGGEASRPAELVNQFSAGNG